MHDQPKQVAALLDPVIVAQRKKEEDALGELYNTTLTKRLAREYSTDALVENSEILSQVPEAYTFYNYRREILLHLWQPLTTAHATQAQVNMLLEELKLNSALMKKNYKIYSAFTHRRWILEQLACLAKREANERDGVNNDDTNSNTGSDVHIAESVWRSIIAKELAQCELLLRADERNFHAWNYRRWVLALKKKENSNSKLENVSSSELAERDVCDESNDGSNAQTSLFTPDELLEEQFTYHMINHNFSNYSAWHQRALLLQGVLSRLTKQPFHFFQQEQHELEVKEQKEEEEEEQSKAIHVQLMEEIIARMEVDAQLLINAMYCDPNDQAAWFYAPYLHQVKQTVTTLIQTNYTNNNDKVNDIDDNEREEKITELKRRVESACDKLLQEAARVHVAQSEFADEKCFLPAYFILSTLLSTLSGKNKTNNSDCSDDINKYAVLLDAELHEVISESCDKQENETNDVENINDDINSKSIRNSLRLISIVEYLYTHLMGVDEMRKGLYTAQRNQLIEILSKTA